jgi:hypothetical protein
MIDPVGARHVDQFSSGQVDLTHTGSLLLGLGYTLQWNRSNSDTESVFRHVGMAKLASALPGHLFLAARAELVYATYPDHVVLAAGPTGSAMASIEDENRSQLRIELSRALTPALRVVARYTLALNGRPPRCPCRIRRGNEQGQSGPRGGGRQRLGRFISDLRSEPSEKATVNCAGMVMGAPFCGFFTTRSGRRRLEKVPKPG